MTENTAEFCRENIAVQIISSVTGIVAAQRIVPVCGIRDAEEELGKFLLPEHQALRNRLESHPSVTEFNERVADIAADMERQGYSQEIIHGRH